MKLAGCLLALLGLLHRGLGLQVSLSEPNADHSSPLHLKDSPRTIPLVPGKTYSLLCDGTWHGPGELGVTQDGGNLTLQLDSEDMGGEYVCVDENGAEFVVIITSGNPVLIPSRVAVGLDKTIVRTDFPSLLVFGSGDPQPVPSDYSWYLNGQPFFLNGVQVNTVEGHIRVRFNSIILEKDNIPASIEGTYVSVVNTSFGEMNVSITVSIEVKPSPVVSVLIPADYGEEYVANGESVTFNCSDTVAVPVPTFYWSFNGTRVTDSTPGFAISSGNEGRESYMTVAEVSFSDNRTEIKCEAHNTVEDEPMIGDASLSLTLRDINECEDFSVTCTSNASCVNTAGSYECVCKGGYSGNGSLCIDINECEDGTDSCDENADCTNIDGSYTCACSSGFSGDGLSCDDIDECASEVPCDPNATCTNTAGSYTCQCAMGFSGDGTTCEVQYTNSGNTQTFPQQTSFHSFTSQVAPTSTSKASDIVGSDSTVSTMAAVPDPYVTSNVYEHVIGVSLGVSVTFVTLIAATVIVISVTLCVRRRRKRKKEFISTVNVAYSPHSGQTTMTTKSSDTYTSYSYGGTADDVTYSYPTVTSTHSLPQSIDLIANAAYVSVPKEGDETSESCNPAGDLTQNAAYGVHQDEVELSANVSYAATATERGSDMSNAELSYDYVTRTDVLTSTGI